MKIRSVSLAPLLCGFLAIAPNLRADTLYGPGTFAYTAPTTGVYQIDAAGGAGGADIFGASVGAGLILEGDVTLTAGEVLDIVVGSMGSNNFFYGSGGGGTDVYLQGEDMVLLGAGGGGGALFSAPGEPGVSASPGGSGDIGASDGGVGSGGLSYYDAANVTLTNEAPANTGDGYVDIVAPTATPEPSSLMLLGTGALGLAGVVRRRVAC